MPIASNRLRSYHFFPELRFANPNHRWYTLYERTNHMTQDQQPTQVQRIFEQPPDAISLYSDLAQVIRTQNEIVLQFYETIPGPPGPGGEMSLVRTRLRATITVSLPHAVHIGDILRTRTQQPPPEHPGVPQ